MGKQMNFKEYLEEGRDAPLYHGTTLTAAEKILESGKIRPYSTHDPKTLLKKYAGSGISTSRNLKFLKLWAYALRIIFELDQRKLAQRYKIVPVDYFHDTPSRKPSKYYSEYEEFILTNNDIKLKNYCTKILYNKKFLSLKDIDLIEYYAEILNIPTEAY